MISSLLKQRYNSFTHHFGYSYVTYVKHVLRDWLVNHDISPGRTIISFNICKKKHLKNKVLKLIAVFVAELLTYFSMLTFVIIINHELNFFPIPEYRGQIMLQSLLVLLDHILLVMQWEWFNLGMQMLWWLEGLSRALMHCQLQDSAGKL